MLTRCLRTAARVQRHLGPRSGWIERVRLHTLPPLDPVARAYWDRPLIRRKGPTDYVCSIELEPSSVPDVVWPTYHRNPLSTKKYRMVDGERQWEVAAWRFVDESEPQYQHHLYYFEGVGGAGTDLYHHKEVAFEADPKAHEAEPQIHGDPDGVLRDLLAKEGVSHRRFNDVVDLG